MGVGLRRLYAVATRRPPPFRSFGARLGPFWVILGSLRCTNPFPMCGYETAQPGPHPTPVSAIWGPFGAILGFFWPTERPNSPKWLKMTPKWPKKRPKMTQNGPKGPKMA